MSFMTVPSQVQAVEYVRRIAKETGDALMLGGHSKGGNLAVFAAARSNTAVRDRIRRVYSFDGPGLDEEIMAAKGYALLGGRIESYLPQSSVVGMLLHHHPEYTVVRSKSVGILQHDAMNWQVRDGAFVTLRDLNLTGKLTDETMHGWLKGLDMESRRLLVDTLYQILASAQATTLDGMVKDWYKSALRMIRAMRDLDPHTRKNIRRMLSRLFGASTAGAIRKVMAQALLSCEKEKA